MLCVVTGVAQVRAYTRCECAFLVVAWLIKQRLSELSGECGSVWTCLVEMSDC